MTSMAEHKEETTMDKISDKFHGEDSWSSSDLDDKKKTKRSAAAVAATDIKPKAFPSGATARFRDLPEVLRRQLGGVDERAGHGFLIAAALAPPSGLSERPAVRYLLIPLAGEVISPVERNTGHGDDVRDAIRYYANISPLQFDDDDDEKVVYQLDASSNPQARENVGGGLVQPTNVFPAWVEVSDVFRLDAAAFAPGTGAPFADKEQFDKNDAAGLDLERGVAFVPDDADTLVEKLLGNNRADEHGAPYSDGSCRSPYVVHVINLVLVEDSAAKTDGPIAQAAGVGAGGESARRGVGGDNLSAVLGIVAASSAVTAVATGTVGPVVAFGFFVVMLGGVVAAMSAVRGP